ncbi:MAG: DNA polymerase III subunit gamma/tau [Burkholderiaceae bacterium]
MSHQVLARKWRPRAFDALVGQDHVVRALSHALETGRLHHAYLFTGTRGVGKTTVARILAKAVNCERGMSPTPCGQCSACTQIDGGGFIDYLELDAASNRGVDEMVHILDNAVYAPTAGRYKVYVIDEVHMLTAHAFNAMLKTLEEPPPHMLFILATTDPQKVPVTVLSRCMQFNLRNMKPRDIADHLGDVLTGEQITFEAPALELIGRAAAGSMRDALSLTDQAIAAGSGVVGQAQVREMLGMIDSEFVGRVLSALSVSDGPALVAIADELADTPETGARLLSDLATELADMAAGLNSNAGNDKVADIADGTTVTADRPDFDAAAIQVFYQIAIYGLRDLPLAPDSRSGLVMALLRMLAFAGAADTASGAPPAPPSPAVPNKKASGAAAARAALAGKQAINGATMVQPSTQPSTQPSVTPKSAPSAGDPASLVQSAITGSRAERPRTAMEKLVAGERPVRRRPDPLEAAGTDPAGTTAPPGMPGEVDMPPAPPDDDTMMNPATAATRKQLSPGLASSSERVRHSGTAQPVLLHLPGFEGDWPTLARRIGLNGRPGQFLMQSQLERVDGRQLFLRVPVEQLAEQKLVDRVSEALAEHIPGVKISVQVGRIDGETAAVEIAMEREEQLIQARERLEADPFVKTLINDFDAIIIPESVRAIDAASLNHGENT